VKVLRHAVHNLKEDGIAEHDPAAVDYLDRKVILDTFLADHEVIITPWKA
jgi:hypothetical protein